MLVWCCSRCLFSFVAAVILFFNANSGGGDPLWVNHYSKTIFNGKKVRKEISTIHSFDSSQSGFKFSICGCFTLTAIQRRAEEKSLYHLYGFDMSIFRSSENRQIFSYNFRQLLMPADFSNSSHCHLLVYLFYHLEDQGS